MTWFLPGGTPENERVARRVPSRRARIPPGPVARSGVRAYRGRVRGVGRCARDTPRRSRRRTREDSMRSTRRDSPARTLTRLVLVASACLAFHAPVLASPKVLTADE